MSMTLRRSPIGGAGAASLRSALLAGPPADDIAAPGRTVFAFVLADAVIGHDGMEDRGDAGLVRSVVAEPRMRRRGQGRAITGGPFDAAPTGGCRGAFPLSGAARAFLEADGSGAADRIGAPGPIRASRAFVDLCPAGAAPMERTLP